MKTVFLRALEAEDKSAVLLAAIHAPETALGRQRFEVDPSSFATIARSPFAYWVGHSILHVFQEIGWRTAIRREAKNGLGTLDDFRFVRLANEAPCATRDNQLVAWVPFSKGGQRSPYYQDVSAYVNWRRDGSEIKAHIEHTYGGGHWSRNARSVDYYFLPGLSWPLRGVRFSARAVPRGGIFSVGGKMLFAEEADLPLLLAFLNSNAFDLLVRIFAGKVGGVQYESGLIEGIPIVSPGPSDRGILELRSRRAWSLRRSLDTSHETSHAFILPALLQVESGKLAGRTAAWAKRVSTIETELATIQAEIDKCCFDLYGIGEADRLGIIEGFAAAIDGATDGDEPGADSTAESEDEEVEGATDCKDLVMRLVSWAVGVAFGRFDVRLAMGNRQVPQEPEPFDPLPRCSPGMLTGEGDLPAPTPPADYPLPVPDHGILVGDEGRAASLTHRVREVFRVVFGDAADDRWDEAATILDLRGRDLRPWLGREFFALHIKQYSKSRRKAPIYWQLATPSASYSVWLYYPRLTRDTLFRALQDEVTATLQREERALAERHEAVGQNPGVSQRRDLDAAEHLVEELRSFRDEMARVAPLWNPDLDDGVIINFAPLWRLVPHHKVWQRELKATWDALCVGEYDWAHLAMHLWPERVVPKCAEDRSLAIAHGLEEVFWEQDVYGKWTPCDEPTRPIEELIRERTSPAVKAALAGLLEAPQATGPARGQGGGRRSARGERR